MRRPAVTPADARPSWSAPHHGGRAGPRIVAGAAVALAYAVTLMGANLLTSHYGLVPAGFGLTVTAGTYAAGLALALRDSLQSLAGLPVAIAAMLVGITASALTADPRIVTASIAATAVGELTDLAVYTPLRVRGRRRALAASCALGAVADTVLFLSLAGFTLTAAAVGGQVLVKAVWVTGSYLLLGEGVRRVVSGQRLQPGGA